MAINKTFAVSLDMKAPTAQRNEWEVVEGDNGNIIEITLTDNGEPVDLTGCRVLAVFGLPTGETVEQDTDEGSVTVGGTDNNVITIALKTGSFSPGKSSSGLMKCEIQVYSGLDKDTLVTSAQFTFRCRRAIINDETVPADNNYPILVELIQDVQSFIRSNQSDWNQSDSDEPDYIRNKPATMTPTSHTHGNITNEGTITSDTTAASGDKLVLTDASNSSKLIRSGIAFGSATNTWLRNDGTWAAPTAEQIGAVSTGVVGEPSGVATLDSSGKVPSSQLDTKAPIVEVTANKTLALTDAGCLLQVNRSSDQMVQVNITVPANSVVAFPIGTEIEVCKWGSSNVLFTTESGSNVLLKSVWMRNKITLQFGCAVLKKMDTDTWLMAGDLTQ